MKIKYNDKHYCISPCAKDKFETFILGPLAGLVVMVAVLIPIFAVLSIIGFIAEGISVVFFGFGASTEGGTWLIGGLGVLIISVFLAGVVKVIYVAVKSIYKLVLTMLSSEYTKRHKLSCKLFVECEA